MSEATFAPERWSQAADAYRWERILQTLERDPELEAWQLVERFDVSAATATRALQEAKRRREVAQNGRESNAER